MELTVRTLWLIYYIVADILQLIIQYTLNADIIFETTVYQGMSMVYFYMMMMRRNVQGMSM